MRRLQVTLALFWCVAVGLSAQEIDRPLRAVHLSGNWGHTADAVARWELDRTQPLVPLRYVEYLRSVHVDWVGFSVALHVEHSMDATVELYGAFFWDTWINVYEGHWQAPSLYRAYSFVGKPSERTVREWYETYRTTAWRLPLTLHVSGAGAVAAALPFVGPARASSSSRHVVVAVDGSRVVTTPASEGSATITVAAAGVTHRFIVRVLPVERPADAIPIGAAIRAVHSLALRAEVDALRARENLPPLQWTDPVLTIGATPVKRVHLAELGEGLGDVYDAVGQPRPTSTDGAIVAGVTGIKAAHVEQLRAAALARAR